ncbi:hypothetical protein DFH09DRAFT_1102896 [Mycena vulgaris]|nr:hypothetical protein DFH09DRAFT_1102896 [Mycena vulgaris]
MAKYKKNPSRSCPAQSMEDDSGEEEATGARMEETVGSERRTCCTCPPSETPASHPVNLNRKSREGSRSAERWPYAGLGGKCENETETDGMGIENEPFSYAFASLPPRVTTPRRGTTTASPPRAPLLASRCPRAGRVDFTSIAKTSTRRGRREGGSAPLAQQEHAPLRHGALPLDDDLRLGSEEEESRHAPVFPSCDHRTPRPPAAPRHDVPVLPHWRCSAAPHSHPTWRALQDVRGGSTTLTHRGRRGRAREGRAARIMERGGARIRRARRAMDDGGRYPGQGLKPRQDNVGASAGEEGRGREEGLKIGESLHEGWAPFEAKAGVVLRRSITRVRHVQSGGTGQAGRRTMDDGQHEGARVHERGEHLRHSIFVVFACLICHAYGHASGIQINGGSFFDVAGDMNLHSTQPTMGQDSDPLRALEFGLTEGPGRQLWGVERNSGEVGAARMLPYGMVLSPSQSSSHSVPNVEYSLIPNESAPSLLNPPPFPFSYPEHEFTSLSFFESGGASDPTTAHLALFRGPINNTASEYPQTHVAPTSGTPREYRQMFPSDNRPSVVSTSLVLVPNPVPSTHIFSGQAEPLFPPSFPTTASFQEPPKNRHHLHPITYISTDFEHRAQLFGHSLEFEQQPSFLPPSPLLRPPNPLASTFSQAHSDFNRPVVPRPITHGGYISRDTPGGSWQLQPENRAIEYPLANDFEGTRSSPDGPPPPGHHGPRTNISGGTFIGGNVNHIQRNSESGLHILYRAAAGDATHNSEDRFPQPRCHPETRTMMLDVLWNWTRGIEPPKNWNWTSEDDESEVGSFSDDGSSSDNDSSPMLWLHGPAGSGKSAIAQSFCQKLEEKGRLGASFFFKRGHSSRGHAKRLFATIAYQLALRLPDFNRHISEHGKRPITCRQIHFDTTTEVDCRTMSTDQQATLCSIGRAVDDQQLPLRILVASRPEPHIHQVFTDVLNGVHCPLHINQSFKDVQKYLRDEFARIYREHHATMAMVPEPWPSLETIDDLVQISSGHFIYASMVIKFIDDKDFRPTERLEVIMGIKEPDVESPFAALDQLYTQILSKVHARPQLLKILAAISVPLFLSPSDMEQLLELEPGDVLLALRGLHSVIGFYRFSEPDSQLVVHHASFCDFLRDPARAGRFYVGGCLQRTDLSRHILKSFLYKHDDPALNRRGHVSRALPLRVFKWIASSEPSSDLVTLLHSFNPEFLFGPLQGDREENLSSILDWLEQIQPLPEGLIQLWEDYRFMCYCEGIWCDDKGTEVTGTDRDHYRQILSQAAPSLIKIFQAIEFLIPGDSSRELLFKLHFLLDFTWSQEGRHIRNVLIVALDPTLFPVRFDSITWDLTCGSLRVMVRILSGEVNKQMDTLGGDLQDGVGI